MQHQTLPDGSQVCLIHYTYFIGGLGNGWRIACMPTMTNLNPNDALHPNYQRSNDKRAVNCPMCKKANAFTANHFDTSEGPKN